MKLIRHILTFLAFVATLNCFSQGSIYNFGEEITIKGGDFITIKKDYVNNAGNGFNGEINSEGKVKIGGDITNNTSNPIFTPGSTGKVLLNGSGEQNLSGDSINFPYLIVKNTSGQNVIVNNYITIEDTLQLSAGVVEIKGTGTVNLGSFGYLYGENNSNYVTGWGKIQAVSKAPNSSNIAGLGISTQGTSGNLTVRRWGRFPNAGEDPNKKYFRLTATNTSDLTIGWHYFPHEIAIADENELWAYTSSDNNIYRRNTNTTVFPSMDSASFTLNNFKDGWIALSNKTCASPPSFTITPATPEFCSGDSVQLSTETTTDELIWSTGQNTSSIYENTTGSLQLKRIADNGCLDSVEVTVNENPVPTTNFNFNSTSDCEGSVFTFNNTSGGATIVQDDWDFNDGNTSTLNSPIHTFNGVGLFDVQLKSTTDKGCVDSLTQQIRIHPNPVAKYFRNGECSGQEVNFINNSDLLSPVDGQAYAFFQREWTINDTANTLTNGFNYTFNTGGTYNVKLKVTTNAGCVDSITKSITINSTPVADFTIPSSSLCQTYTYTPTNTTSDASAYNWYLDNTLLSTANEPSFSENLLGNHILKLVADNSGLCQDSLETAFVVEPTPVISYTLDKPCVGESLLFEAQDSNGDITLNTTSWEFSNGTNATTESTTQLFADTGSYNLSLISINPEGCSDTLIDVVQIVPLPSVDFDTAYFCSDENIQLTNNSIYGFGTLSYQWIYGEDTLSGFQPSYTPSDSGLITTILTATADNNCEASITKSVCVIKTPDLQFNDSLISCAAQASMDLSVLGDTFLWCDNSTAPTNTFNTDGQIYVQVTNKGCTATDTTYIKLNTYSEIWEEDSTQYCDTGTLNVFQVNSSYDWNTGDTSAAISINTSGLYKVTQDDGFGCVRVDSLYVNVYETPVLNLQDTLLFCDTENGKIYTNYPTLSNLWSNGHNGDTLETNVAGQYNVIVDNQGCIARDTVVFEAVPIPLFTLVSDTSACDSIAFGTNTVADAYLWSNDSTSAFLDLLAPLSETLTLTLTNGGLCSYSQTTNVNLYNTPISALAASYTGCDGGSVSAYAGQADTYLWSDNGTAATNLLFVADTFFVTITNGNLCSTTDTSFVTFVSKPDPSLGEDTAICGYDEYYLTKDYSGLNVEWYKDASLIGTGTQQVIDTSGSFVVRIFDDGLNCIESDTINISLLEDIYADFAATSLAVVEDSIQFVQTISPHPTEFYWEFGDGILSEEENPIHRYFIADSFNVQLIAIYGTCTDTISKGLRVYNAGEVPIDIYLDSIPSKPIATVNVYPNPVEDDLTIEYDADVALPSHAYIIDADGTVRWNKLYQDASYLDTIDVSALPSGVYNVWVLTGKSIIVFKVVRL